MNLIVIKKIRELQKAEGNRPCFQTKNTPVCQYQEQCCWAGLCLNNIRPKPSFYYEVIG